jgi:hypothetical protein
MEPSAPSPPMKSMATRSLSWPRSTRGDNPHDFTTGSRGGASAPPAAAPPCAHHPRGLRTADRRWCIARRPEAADAPVAMRPPQGQDDRRVRPFAVIQSVDLDDRNGGQIQSWRSSDRLGLRRVT